ncbi:MgtC/SapB family protein [Paenibacillus alkaliterrae]|uniref:MgtC/SapB family protein n=1 Tax=Paenibacillus alkaliterrae TaxID=320909 RepID=UPI001F22C661|nr:MgtC/SapB family protein [Paenibacillus alkaliterrae]MCF2939258.1 MgtC/SapB family protein [Paenibacillus alkaliterrae]
MDIIETEIWQISYLDLSLRLIAAVVLGGLIGIEREWSNHAAGFRTHILVCLGSAAIMLLSIYGFSEFAYEFNVRMDPARLAAQVVSGIGFLGAGAIMRTGVNVSGLTTAASIWVVAAIGLCAGAGFYYGAGLVTVLVLFSLFLLNKLEKRMHNKRSSNEVKIRVGNTAGGLGAVTDIFDSQGLKIIQMAFETEYDEKNDENIRVVRIKLHKPSPKQLMEVVDAVLALEQVKTFETSDRLRDYKGYAGHGASSSI